MSEFKHGTAYPIKTLDDLDDADVRGCNPIIDGTAMFWNDCQGWWHGQVSSVLGADRWRPDVAKVALFWMPEPPAPMTRDEIMAMREAAT